MNTQYRTKKRFGQHFLHDQSVIAKIINAANIGSKVALQGSKSVPVLEIGPGMGALTHQLLKETDDLHVMELDRDLCHHWSELNIPTMSLHQGDALDLKWDELLPSPPYILVSNLPYNISTQIVFKVLSEMDMFSRLVLMFQREVGERICATPGGKDFGILSVLCQIWFDVSKVVIVKPGSFSPPPKIDSIVLQFDRRSEPRYQVPPLSIMTTIVKGLFAKRRKTLNNNLNGLGVEKAKIAQLLNLAEIDGARRAETLSIEEFCSLACLLVNEKYIDIQERKK